MIVGALDVLGALAAIVTLVTVIITLFHAQPDAVSKILALEISLFFVIAVIVLVARELQYSRRARFAEAQTNIHEAFHLLRDCWFDVQKDVQTEAIIRNIKASLEYMSSAFSLIAGIHCRMCIKEIYGDPSEQHGARSLRVCTLTRSEVGPTGERFPEPDWLVDNTDFEELFKNPERRCFFENNLLELKKRGVYKNSHWTEERLGKKDYDYFSTIVWPIRKAMEVPVPQVEAISERQDLIGFLCADSLAKGKFSRRFDFWMGAAYADILYVAIKALKLRDKVKVLAAAGQSDLKKQRERKEQ